MSPQHARSLCLGVILALTLGCASTEVRGRHVTRLGPLRSAPLHPAGAADEPLLLEAGRDVLDDAELARMKGELARYFQDTTARLANEHAATTSARGLARVQRCTLSASPTPRATVYLARCRVALEVEGVPVASVEASAERRTRARAVSEARAAEIRALTRNPLLEYDDARGALESALDEALRLLITGAAPERDELDPLGAPAVAVDEAAMREDAVQRLAKHEGPALAAACIDLGRYGTAADGIALAAHLDDDSALVRRACATAIGELGAKDAYPALQRRSADVDKAAGAAIELAKQRLRALYPDLPPDERPPETSSKPSNSSTEGGGV